MTLNLNLNQGLNTVIKLMKITTIVCKPSSSKESLTKFSMIGFDISPMLVLAGEINYRMSALTKVVRG